MALRILPLTSCGASREYVARSATGCTPVAIVIRYPGSRSYPNTTIVVVGGLSNGMTYVLDGGTHNEAFNNLGLPLPFPDAMQEFKVETSARSTCSATVQYNNPVSALNNSNFGLITSAADARVIQLALKYTF